MILYHGSNLAVTQPRLLPSDRRLDFGTGFYLTSSYEQAALDMLELREVRENE